MKKIIARFGVNNDERDSSGNASSFNSLIGRQLNVGGRTVIIEELIAEGGFGVVFKVRDLSQRHYALKRLCVNSDENLSRCKQEINILKLVTHKNIIRLVDAGVVRNQNGVCEVMILLQFCRDSVSDLIEQSLSSRISIPEQTVLRIFCDMCEAVGCLHEQNIIHRDLKLENVLIDDNGNYVLCDFGSATRMSIIPKNYGISKTEEEISKYTTLAYRAPEMVDLYGGMEISTKADIWALGCLLYTLCFLKLPFKDSALAIQSGEYSIPDYHDYGVNIVKIIGYMLHVDPVRRPDIYQVSALAFQMTSDCVSPLRNINNSIVPKFEDLPLPTKESEMKAKAATKVSVPTPTVSNEPVKTSVKPRQRPRVCGTQSLNLSNLAPPGEQQSRGNSAESSHDEDLYSIPPPPVGDETSRSMQNDIGLKSKNKNGHPTPSMSGDKTDNSSSIEKSSSPLINLTNEDINNFSKEPPGGCLPRQFSENLAPPKSAEPLGVSSTSLLDLDLLSFDSPKPAVPMLNQSTTGNFPGSSYLTVGAGRGQQAPGPMNARVGHRRLLSDTSAIAGPNHNFSGNYIRPPTRISQMPQWGPPRFGLPPAQQPLTASVSMDYIRFAGVMQQQQQVQHMNYQLPPQIRMPQQQQWTHGQSHYLQPPSAVQHPPKKQQANVDQNPHHQWKHPLRGNRPLSSSSADLMNMSVGTSKPDQYQSALLQKPMHQLAVGTKSMPATNLLNNRTTSAVELDAFGSVPFSAMSIPTRPFANQGHTRSASHGQFFAKN